MGRAAGWVAASPSTGWVAGGGVAAGGWAGWVAAGWVLGAAQAMFAHFLNQGCPTDMQAICGSGDHCISVFQGLLDQTFLQPGQIIFEINTINRKPNIIVIRYTANHCQRCPLRFCR